MPIAASNQKKGSPLKNRTRICLVERDCFNDCMIACTLGPLGPQRQYHPGWRSGKPLPVAAFALLFGRKRLPGLLIGGIKEAGEMLDFCGAHSITADVEILLIQQINEVCERQQKSDVPYRFSIDMASLKK